MDEINVDRNDNDNNDQRTVNISDNVTPSCNRCLYRIDPVRLGLPALCVQNLCSKFCPSPSLVGNFRSNDELCPKQRFLKQYPDWCNACQVIDQYWNSISTKHGCMEEEALFCGECSMHQTLWTCLTCGFVGCGRYSNKHSVAHFEKTRHPYSLELATLRIWDYRLGDYGGFVHRSDLLECPSSPPLLYLWLTRRLDFEYTMNFPSTCIRNHSLRSNQKGSTYDSNPRKFLSMMTVKSSKKAVMVADEYEALLQSVLEDQANFFEAEITRLRGEFTSSLVNQNAIDAALDRDIESLKHDINIAKDNIEQVSNQLLEAQGQELRLRAVSHRLLSDQQECNEMIKKIQEEHRKENEREKMQIEDLEHTIVDLGANLSIQETFSQNNEFCNASIGFISAPESKKPSCNSKKDRKKGKSS